MKITYPVLALCLPLLLCAVSPAAAQTKKKAPAKKTVTKRSNAIDPATLPSNAPKKAPVFMYVEQMPSYPGDLSAFLSRTMRYPDSAISQGIEGRVVVKFIVTEYGTIANPVVARSVHRLLDAEALRVVSLMPKWTPGRQNGKPANVYYMLPLDFKLE